MLLILQEQLLQISAVHRHSQLYSRIPICTSSSFFKEQNKPEKQTHESAHHSNAALFYLCADGGSGSAFCQLN